MTIAQQILCDERELALRKRVYPRWIASGQIRQSAADYETACMAAIVETLKSIQDEPSKPKQSFLWPD